MESRGPVFVGVSGPPASGKSTLAPLLAARLHLPLLAKDTIKDALMATMPPADVEASRELGRAAVAVMFALAAGSPVGAVLESAFYRSRAEADIRALPGPFVEVFCRCDREVALARYRSRMGDPRCGPLRRGPHRGRAPAPRSHRARRRRLAAPRRRHQRVGGLRPGDRGRRAAD